MRDAVGHGDLVETVQAGDLLDQVHLAREILAERGDRADDLAALQPRAQAESRENLHLPLRGNLQAQELGRPLGAERELPRLGRLGPNIHRALCDLSAGQFDDQLAGPQAGLVHAHRVHAALESVVAVAHKLQPSRRLAD